MLQFEGNTAAFLNYAYVRIQSIKRKVLEHSKELDTNFVPKLTAESELDLAFHICQFPDVIDQTTKELMPNRLCDYLHNLAELFHSFFHHCRVEGAPEQNDRLFLCNTTARVLKQGLFLLGLTPLETM